MADEHHEDMRQAIAFLLQRQEELEARVRELEARASAEPVSPAAIPPPMTEAGPPPMDGVAPPPIPPPIPDVLPAQAPELAPPLVHAAPPPIPASVARVETQVGLNWVNRIAVITLMLGAAFLFKYGVDN